MTMMTPTLHLNGTSAAGLTEQIADAAGAVRQAIRAADAAAPNTRDYYPQGDHAFGIAAREHASRIERLRAVLQEYEQAYEILQDQIDARAAQRLP
jgi:hypothetical protein